MSIYSKIQTDLITALKAKEQVRLNVLRFIVSQVKYKQIESKGEATDELVVATIRKQVKELQEAAAEFTKLGRAELATENEAQVKILNEYLPATLSEDALKQEIQKLIDANRDAFTTNPRALTGKIVAALKSQADPAQISKVYGEMLK